MKKLITIITLLFMTSCSPTFADDHKNFCKAQQTLAETLMKARQLDIPREGLEQYIGQKSDGRAKQTAMIIVELAYMYQLMDDKPSKKLVKKLFGSEVFSQCFTGTSEGIIDMFLIDSSKGGDNDWTRL